MYAASVLIGFSQALPESKADWHPSRLKNWSIRCSLL